MDATFDAELARLGAALTMRHDDVVARLRELTGRGAVRFDAAIEAQFEDAARTSTVAVAKWIGGSSAEEARSAGWDATRSFGKLSAQRTASLTEVTKRCLRWRDATTDVIVDSAREFGLDTPVVERALAMLRRSFDVTLVRMCDAFEAERQRLHEDLIARETALAFQATHDSLTGLPNRTLILDRIRQGLARARLNELPLAVMFVDLDNFKYINDTYGHDVGDTLLRAVGGRLSGVVRGADTLGRLGGDEFVIVAEGFSLLGGPELIAERIREALRMPFALEKPDAPLTITASIGIAAGDRPAPEVLLRDADIAMYRAKSMGRDAYALFDPEMAIAARSHLLLEMDLRRALEEDQFFLAYQPIFDLRTMRPTGVEALLRWQHPDRGVVPPEQFVSLLEDIGLIASVGRMVLERACRQGAAWWRSGIPLQIAVNVSTRQIESEDFASDIAALLATTGLPPQLLTLEITETALMRDPDASRQRLTAVKELGVRLAIDDFGTGYSSLEYLRIIPVDILKIDQCFVNRMLHDAQGRALIRTFLELGRVLEIETHAEGIESARQLAVLREHECTGGQGFLFARPLPADELTRFLATNPTLVDPTDRARAIL